MDRTIIDVNVTVNGRDAFGKRITPEVLLEVLDFNHITHAVCYNEFAQKNVRKGNSDMRQIAEASNGQLGLSVLLDPALGAESLPGEGTLIERLREWKPDTKVVVGGAVMTQEYADAIGADCYAPDAMATVHYAEEVFGISP